MKIQLILWLGLLFAPLLFSTGSQIRITSKNNASHIIVCEEMRPFLEKLCEILEIPYEVNQSILQFAMVEDKEGLLIISNFLKEMGEIIKTKKDFNCDESLLSNPELFAKLVKVAQDLMPDQTKARLKRYYLETKHQEAAVVITDGTVSLLFPAMLVTAVFIVLGATTNNNTLTLVSSLLFITCLLVVCSCNKSIAQRETTLKNRIRLLQELLEKYNDLEMNEIIIAPIQSVE